MTIDQFIKEHDKDIINGIEFQLFDVNSYEYIDIYEKVPFDYDGVDEEKDLSFIDRLYRAKEELEDYTKGMTMDQAKEYFKDQTEDGNSNFWGGMVYVDTHDINNDDCIYYGVRMD